MRVGVAVVMFLLLRAASVLAACVGDCNGDTRVAINELVLGVNIALDQTPISNCPIFDRNGDDRVSVDELVAGVGNALQECPAEPGSTPTPTATPTLTPTLIISPSPTSVPRNLSYGETVTARLQTLGEKHTYRLQVAAGDVLRIRMSGPSEVDPQIEVFDAQGGLLAQAGSFAATLSVDVVAVVSGPLFVLLSDVDGANIGQYGVTVQRLNGAVGAVPLAAGQVLSGRIDLFAEIDAYTLAPAAGDVLRIRMSGPSEVNPQIEVRDAQGALVALAGSFAATVSVDVVAVVSGPLFVLLSDVDGTSIGRYGVTVQRLNGPVGAVALTAGQVLNARIDALAELDAYTFVAETGDVVRIRMSGPSEVDPHVEVFNAQGNLLAEASSFEAETSVDVTVESSGLLLILLSDLNGASTGDYEVSVEKVSVSGSPSP